MSTFAEHRRNLMRALAGERAQRDLLKVACAEAGAEYRVVHVPPDDAGTGAPDRDTVRRWPTEAYAGRPYQLRADDRPLLQCPPGAIEQMVKKRAPAANPVERSADF
ncbi:hypothetical protein CCAX7_55350 [Capsulimonas corticalis]|uniref:Uncharacterized protein n=1 Tax=Capsulimonas corticalis TaxID=2219043 RepID=A0A402D5P6_9BACT|nr:hypothetical protein [Capsulimonas corticalis]BDI33484.1 hypothetical protein CCAX7_55350 [Capsulimonas corticalis]